MEIHYHRVQSGLVSFETRGHKPVCGTIRAYYSSFSGRNESWAVIVQGQPRFLAARMFTRLADAKIAVEQELTKEG